MAATTPATIEEHILHPEETQPITRVVCLAIDASGYSEYAVDWAVHNFLNKATDLVVLMNVRPVPVIPGPFGTTYVDFTDYLSTIEDQNRKESHALLHYYGNQLKKQGFAIKAIALRGDPRDELVRKVKEVNGDVLLLGSRGLGMIKRALLGSLSDYCIHHVDIPVLVVKHPHPEVLPQYGEHHRELMSQTAEKSVAPSVAGH